MPLCVIQLRLGADMWGFILLNLVLGLVTGGLLWLATRPTQVSSTDPAGVQGH